MFLTNYAQKNDTNFLWKSLGMDDINYEEAASILLEKIFSNSVTKHMIKSEDVNAAAQRGKFIRKQGPLYKNVYNYIKSYMGAVDLG